ncbi:NAD-dependent epimerase/dehydratase family protein [Haloarchaeobius litoreus]|uniref:NAD-dependent epimerase/dehydratase family protein n=1 Tax=Haloarchaeobius litoreus TaxID=755306 RepID=A0ABD6DR27_9EURY|nr:NAD-dependent epimerase/dehydratase family protein [Haloarchaeobius litoreus]
MPSSHDPAVSAGRHAEESSPEGTADLADATVLVTGGAGFIGRQLVQTLSPGVETRVLDSGTSDRRAGLPDETAVLEGDVTNPADLAAAMAGVDVVFHLAAYSSVPATLDHPTRSLDVNAVGTAAVLDRARTQDARVVVASSAAVYGRPAETPIPEDAPLRPRSPYGVGKLAADRYARRYEDWYDVPAVALRFFNVYGPGHRNGVLATFLSRARQGDPLVIHGDGSQTRDFVHVDDVVRALLAAARTDATGEAFNVGTGETTTVRELARLVQETVPGGVDVLHDDPRPADIEHSCADVRKAREQLGFEAELELEEGLQRLVDGPDS